MRRVRAAIAYVILLSGLGSAAFAQSAGDPPPLASSPLVPLDLEHILAAPDAIGVDASRRAAELQQWVDDFTAWKEWSAKWRNRREPGLWSSYRGRRESPVPPAWLPGQCATVIDDADSRAKACALLAEWHDDLGTTEVRGVRAAATATTEASPRTVWWEHVHMDLLWPTTVWQSRTFGVVGMHTATAVAGRFEVFTAPGVILLNMPARNGSRAWKFAVNYGIGYRLTEFTFPGQRRAVLHLNLAKAWVMSDVADVATGRSMDFVGFSITFKKSR